MAEGVNVYRQSIPLGQHKRTGLLSQVSHAIHRWVRREIIDDAPYDDEALRMQQLLEEFRQAELKNALKAELRR
ncbi:MAG TPA: hypothetical protein V6D19_21450 [Stenomitos sp.]